MLAVVLFLPPALAVAHMAWTAASRRRGMRCYLLDYVCYKPADDLTLTTELACAIVQRNERLGIPEFRFLVRRGVASMWPVWSMDHHRNLAHGLLPLYATSRKKIDA